ncbi:MAG: hypothetical protein L6Q99_21725 [Planctomycetes bacterium]|nr:hypothetical protein [Planctomycetota bacterium]
MRDPGARSASGARTAGAALASFFATRRARLGVPLVPAQRLLGHSDPTFTARAYSHVEVEDLRAAVELLHTG